MSTRLAFFSRGRTVVGAVALGAILAGCAAPATTPAPATGGSVVSQPIRTDQSAQYGYVSAIEVVPSERRTSGSGAGALIGGALGAVLGNQVGGGSGRTAATVAGAVGGAVAGHQIEKNRSPATDAYYDVRVRLDNGSTRVITVADLGGITVGERVRVQGDSILRL